jgi:hypothetical protein
MHFFAKMRYVLKHSNGLYENLEDENTQLKESLRKADAISFPLRKSDITQIASLERIWSDEKRELQIEMDRLRDRLKVAEEQTTRDVGLIATLEERLKDSNNSDSANLYDIDGEDLNDEMNTSRRNLFDNSEISLICSRLQVMRLERELAASKAETEFNKLSTDSE